MGKLIFVTGGARSGKSTFAEETVKSFKKPVVYIATAIAFDEGMKDRIKKHQVQRPAEWKTIERYKSFDQMENEQAFVDTDVILFDCLTVMVTNNMLDGKVDFDTCSMDVVNEIEQEIRREVELLLEVCHGKTLVMVSNEVGMGLVPPYKLGSYFRDIAGRMNQLVASRADEVYLTVSGIPVKIK